MASNPPEMMGACLSSLMTTVFLRAKPTQGLGWIEQLRAPKKRALTSL